MDTIPVLLVEDNPGDVRLVREALVVTKRTSLQLAHVESVREAIDYMASHDVAVVLLDLSLPDGYGLETFTKVHSARPDVPILVYTSLDDEDVALHALREGAQDYLVKGLLDSMSPERAILYAIERQRIELENRRLAAELEQRVIDRTAELANVKQRLETILNHTPDPIFLLGRHFEIQTANPAFAELFGYGPGDMDDLSLADLVAGNELGTIRAAIHDVIVERNVQRLEMVAITRDGKPFDASIALAPIHDDHGIVGAVCVLRDISGRKEIERLKDDFVSNVSHELRTPITSMKLNLRLLARGEKTGDAIVTRIERENDRLFKIIEDLLTLSRMETGQVALTPVLCSLNSIAEEFVADRTPLAESRGLRLSLNTGQGIPLIEADRGLIGLAMSILLTNAFNYTPSGGWVSVSTHKRLAEGIRWSGVEVRDSGPGIPAEEQKNLFVRFFRGKAGRTSKQPGTGLGLAIARQIMDRHRGRIEVASEGVPGKGAAFTLWLPASEDVNQPAG